MKPGFTLPLVGPDISSAAGLSAFCRELEDVGYDTLWDGDRLVAPVDMDSTYLPRVLWPTGRSPRKRRRDHRPRPCQSPGMAAALGGATGLACHGVGNFNPLGVSILS